MWKWKGESSGELFLENLERLAEETPRDYEKILDLVFNELAPRAIENTLDDTRKMTPEEIAESLED